jgi:hypothetical protein
LARQSGLESALEVNEAKVAGWFQEAEDQRGRKCAVYQGPRIYVEVAEFSRALR